MKCCLSLLPVLVLFCINVFAQDATTNTTTQATCCTVRLIEFELSPTQARVNVHWIRSDSSIQQSKLFIITDGDAGNAADNFLWGTGTGGQPTGIMRKVGSFVADETGALQLRMNKAVLRWLQTNAHIGAAEITIP